MTDEWFEREFKRLRPVVFQSCCRRLGSRDLAEDATQAVFCRAWAARKGVDERGFIGWMATITRNVCSDRLRLFMRKPTVSIGAIGEDGWELEIPDHRAAKPFEEYVNPELIGLLQMLSPDAREAFLLRHDGQSFEEIAAVQGASVHAVKMRIYGAKQRLQKLMGGRYER